MPLGPFQVEWTLRGACAVRRQSPECSTKVARCRTHDGKRERVKRTRRMLQVPRQQCPLPSYRPAKYRAMSLSSHSEQNNGERGAGGAGLCSASIDTPRADDGTQSPALVRQSHSSELISSERGGCPRHQRLDTRSVVCVTNAFAVRPCTVGGGVAVEARFRLAAQGFDGSVLPGCDGAHEC